MKRARSVTRTRIITVSVVLLAASAMSVIPAAAAEPVRDGGGAAAGAACSPAARDGTAGPDDDPAAGHRQGPRPPSELNEAPARSRGGPLLDDSGIVLKLSLYRGIGGGVAGAFTEDGMALTLESGVGVGGSFSAGTVVERSSAGLAVEGRASMSGRIWLVRPPDFGFTVSSSGKLQGYMDAKTGHFRTRFRSPEADLAGEGEEWRAEMPEARRSWSMGTEFKLAAKYTFRLPWSGIFKAWEEIFEPVLGDWHSRAPPTLLFEALACPAVIRRAAFRRVFAIRRHGSGHRAEVADRFPAAFRALPMTSGRHGRPGRSGRTPRASRTPASRRTRRDKGSAVASAVSEGTPCPRPRGRATPGPRHRAPGRSWRRWRGRLGSVLDVRIRGNVRKNGG